MLSYAITPGHGLTPAIKKTCEQLFAAGISFLQIREKLLPDRDILVMAESLLNIRGSGPSKILINDRLDIAIAAGADGVHIGGHSLPASKIREHLPERMTLAVSTHNRPEILEAEAGKADLITFSPVFSPRSKNITGDPAGLEKLDQVCSSTSIPVFALGGISNGNITSVSKTNCAGVAAISMFFQEENIDQLLYRLAEL